jgi:hypothetical protein
MTATPTEEPAPQHLTTRQKIVLGGLGALTPIVVNLLVVDSTTIFGGLTALVLIGYVIRIVVLFYLGGLVAYLHKEENSGLQLFELGIVAPALITSLMNGARIDAPVAPVPAPASQSGFHMLVVPMHAQGGTAKSDKVRTFTLPPETTTEQLWRGITGAQSRRIWFVIASSHAILADAERQAAQINARTAKDFTAEVYAPYGSNRQYSVVIGANLTNADAEALKQRAVARGISKDVYLWTFPSQ